MEKLDGALILPIRPMLSALFSAFLYIHQFIIHACNILTFEPGGSTRVLVCRLKMFTGMTRDVMWVMVMVMVMVQCLPWFAQW